MAYLDADETFGVKKLTAIGTAGAINLGIGAVLIFGLTVADVVKKDERRTEGVFITPDPVKPPPPTPQPDTSETEITSTINVPTPPIQVPVNPPDVGSSDPVVITDYVATKPNKPIDIVIEPPAPPPPPPKALFEPVSAVPSNSPARWVTTRDYPSRDLREGNEGVSRFVLSINASGKVTGCRISGSSGHDALDARTCDKVQQRAQFKPAKDATGAAVAGSYSGSVQWSIPE